MQLSTSKYASGKAAYPSVRSVRRDQDLEDELVDNTGKYRIAASLHWRDG